MTFKAQAGRGDELASAMLTVAEGLRGFPGCEAYLISQDRADADTVHVLEVWADDDAADAALRAAQAAADAPVGISDVLAMLADRPQRVDFVPRGGVGF